MLSLATRLRRAVLWTERHQNEKSMCLHTALCLLERTPLLFVIRRSVAPLLFRPKDDTAKPRSEG